MMGGDGDMVIKILDRIDTLERQINEQVAAERERVCDIARGAIRTRLELSEEFRSFKEGLIEDITEIESNARYEIDSIRVNRIDASQMGSRQTVVGDIEIIATVRS
jgi:hypothetical protein